MTAVLGGLLALSPAAGARTGATLSLNVTFFANNTISVTLPDGTPVGTTSGAPTVIPAGFYTVVLTGPGGCTLLPHWRLKGPGENLVENMTEGEVANATENAFFQPNSTYTWSNDEFPNVVFTFVTSGDVQGSAPVVGPTGISAGKHGTASSTDPIGSARAPFRGNLTGGVSASGQLTLALKGKSVTGLTAGRYKFIVTDQSKDDGFFMQKVARKPVTVTTKAFVGKRTVTLNLTAGKWQFGPQLGKTAFSVVVIKQQSTST